MIRRAFFRSAVGAVAAMAASLSYRPTGRGVPLDDVLETARLSGSGLYIEHAGDNRFHHHATFLAPCGTLQIRWNGTYDSLVTIAGYTMVRHHVQMTPEQHIGLRELGI